MNLKVYILSCMAILLSAATIKPTSKFNHRQKRTIQYFWDGLFSVLKERLPMNARTVNDHRLSTLVSLAKLSSTSTQSKNVQYFDDDDIIENVLNFNHEKSPLNIQMPIPSIASTLLASTENRLVPTMTKRVELDVKLTKHSKKNLTSQMEKIVPKTSTTIAPNQIPTTTIAPCETQPTIDMITSNQTLITNTTTTTMTPNNTQTTTITTTTATETTSIKPEDLTTLNPLESAMINTKNLSSLNIDDTQTKMEKRNAPIKLSSLHTTQFFDGPLLVENDRSDQHKPIYLDDNCIENNCNKDDNVIQPRYLPNTRNAPFISMTIALPVSASTVDQQRQIRNYNVFTLHTHIPIYTEVNSKRLSNEIKTE